MEKSTSFSPSKMEDMNALVRSLSLIFDGKGEKSGWTFTQLLNGNAYLYEVKNGCVYYEVFRHKVNNYYKCVSYPKSESFGIWAWCYKSKEKAIDKYNELIHQD